MKMDSVNKWIALAANIGVISSIIFLAWEINQNNDQLAAQSRYNYFQTRMLSVSEAIRNLDYLESQVKLKNGEELSAVESERNTLMNFNTFTGWEYEIGEFLQGRLSIEDLNAPGKTVIFQLGGTFMLNDWNVYKGVAPSYFVDFMEENVVNR